MRSFKALAREATSTGVLSCGPFCVERYLFHRVDYVKDDEASVRRRIVNVKFKRVPLVAISQVERANEKSIVVRMAVVSQTCISFLQMSEEPRA